MSREARIIDTLVELADILVTPFEPDDLLYRLVDSCLEVLDAQAAGVLLRDQSGELRAVTATSRDVKELEVFEVALSEGPSYEAFRSGEQVAVDDLANHGHEWPNITSAAQRQGFAACYGFPLRWHDDTVGALNVFLTAAQAPMSMSDQRAGRGLADIATIALLQGQRSSEADARTEQLQQALDNRVLIEQAKGLLGERHGLGAREAFERLRRYCRGHNLSLHQAAQEILEGRLDPEL